VEEPHNGTVIVGLTQDPSRTHSHNIGPKSGPRLVVYLVKQTQGLLNAETHHTSMGHVSGFYLSEQGGAGKEGIVASVSRG
jgi:hypothetical protein